PTRKARLLSAAGAPDRHPATAADPHRPVRRRNPDREPAGHDRTHHSGLEAEDDPAARPQPAEIRARPAEDRHRRHQRDDEAGVGNDEDPGDRYREAIAAGHRRYRDAGEDQHRPGRYHCRRPQRPARGPQEARRDRAADGAVDRPVENSVVQVARMNVTAIRLAAGLLLALALGACSGPGPQFTILSGSENDILEPMVQEFCKSRNATCTVKYQGSLDIALSLKPGNDPEADAVWPAASIWIDMFDTARRVKSVKSIAQMPVILGVKRSKAQALGWIGAKVTTKDILTAVEGGRLKFLMTSATQSNSGASAYLAMLAAGIGKPDLIESGDLDKPEVLATVRGLLRGVERSSGSSGWLADLYREGARTGANYEAMWNYEAVIKETNDKLIADKKEPLYAIYPEDGVSIGDSPLGFVDRGR